MFFTGGAQDLAPCLVFPFVIHPELGALEHLPEQAGRTVFHLSLRSLNFRMASSSSIVYVVQVSNIPWINLIAINQGKLTADDPPLFSEIWTDLLEPAAGEKFWDFWSVSKGEIVIFPNFWGPLEN